MIHNKEIPEVSFVERVLDNGEFSSTTLPEHMREVGAKLLRAAQQYGESLEIPEEHIFVLGLGIDVGSRRSTDELDAAMVQDERELLDDFDNETTDVVPTWHLRPLASLADIDPYANPAGAAIRGEFIDGGQPKLLFFDTRDLRSDQHSAAPGVFVEGWSDDVLPRAKGMMHLQTVYPEDESGVGGYRIPDVSPTPVEPAAVQPSVAVRDDAPRKEATTASDAESTHMSTPREIWRRQQRATELAENDPAQAAREKQERLKSGRILPGEEADLIRHLGGNPTDSGFGSYF